LGKNPNIPQISKIIENYRPSPQLVASSPLSENPVFQRSLNELEKFLGEVMLQEYKKMVEEMMNRIKHCAIEQQYKIAKQQKVISKQINDNQSSKLKRKLPAQVLQNQKNKVARLNTVRKSAKTSGTAIILDKDYRLLTQQHKKDKILVISFMIEAVNSVLKQREMKRQFIDDESTKSWIHKVAKTCLCVEQCFQGDIEEFLDSHPKYIYSNHVCIKLQKHDNALKELETMKLTRKNDSK
jgi:hypothetical protein